jgi:prepilin-type N-terminal cleavage/methylation domain-containing protein
MKISGGKRIQSGFSLVELLLVVAVMAVIAAMGVPRIVQSLADIRLRTSASSIANLIQRARMASVQANRPIPLANAQVGTNTFVFVDGNGNLLPDRNEPQYPLPRRITVALAPPAVNPAALGFNPQPPNTPVRFNARGLPCVMVGLVCNNTVGGGQVGFVYYIQDQRPLGAPGFAAVSVNPTGRSNVLSWDGSAWH